MANLINSHYPFRATTINDHIQKQTDEPVRSGRQILDKHKTPSLIRDDSDVTTIVEEYSLVKAEMRIHLFLCYKVIQKAFTDPERELSFTPIRTTTTLQGAQSPKGRQAGHASLLPRTFDEFMEQMLQRAEDHGLSPEKTLPFFKARFDLTSDEEVELQDNYEEPQYIRTFAKERLHGGSFKSTLKDTQFERNNNATMDNPDASNVYDSRLEAKIKLFLKELEKKRIEKKLTPQESTLELVQWLLKYYEKSIPEIENRIKVLKKFKIQLSKLKEFEKKYLNSHSLPDKEFTQYLKDVEKFLEKYKSLREKKMACASCSFLKEVRYDYSVLEKYNSQPLEEAKAAFIKNQKVRLKVKDFDIDPEIQKFSLYLEEAKIQQEATQFYKEACAVKKLYLRLFGVFENNKFRKPSEKELYFKVCEMTKMASPPRNKRQRDLDENPSFPLQTPSPKKPKLEQKTDQIISPSRRLIFTDDKV